MFGFVLLKKKFIKSLFDDIDFYKKQWWSTHQLLDDTLKSSRELVKIAERVGEQNTSLVEENNKLNDKIKELEQALEKNDIIQDVELNG